MKPWDDYKFCRQLFSEQLKVLQARITYLSGARKFRKIAVTSSVAGEGKTLVSVNLASELAMSGKRVLLLDADTRKPDVGRIMEMESGPGLSDHLSESARSEDVVRPSGHKNLHVISGGSNGPPPALSASGKLTELLDALEGSYDYVIIDTPPVIPVADAIYIKNLVEGVILVFRLDGTPYDLLQKVIEDIGREKIIGVVLNNANLTGRNFGKNYYSKYAYNYISVGDSEASGESPPPLMRIPPE